MNILDAIGKTSLVQLRVVVPPGCAEVFAKLEWENPTGSVKDRMAQTVIARAEADGRLQTGDTVVEYTGGSTGTSLALVCAAKGYRIHIVSSDAFSQEKRDHMAALGAELTLVQSEGGRTTKRLILDLVEVARGLSERAHTYWTDQLTNHDSIAGYYPLGEEIWRQTKGEIDAFVHCVGTAASSRGVATVLKEHRPSIRIVAVELAESSVLLGGQPGPHKIEGVGIGYVPPLWEPTLVDDIVPVRTDDAKAMARRLAREEALFAGTSSGANVVAAIRVAKQLGPGATVVTSASSILPPPFSSSPPRRYRRSRNARAPFRSTSKGRAESCRTAVQLRRPPQEVRADRSGAGAARRDRPRGGHRSA